MSGGLKFSCSRCSRPIEEPGALVFSPPDTNDCVMKLHICVACWRDLWDWLGFGHAPIATHQEEK